MSIVVRVCRCWHILNRRLLGWRDHGVWLVLNSVWATLRLYLRLRDVVRVAEADGRMARMVSLGWLKDHLSSALLHRRAGHHGRRVVRDRLPNGLILLELFLTVFVGGLLIDTELLVAVGAHWPSCQVQNFLLVRFGVVLMVLGNDRDLPRDAIEKVVARIVVKLELAHSDRRFDLFVGLDSLQLLAAL